MSAHVVLLKWGYWFAVPHGKDGSTIVCLVLSLIWTFCNKLGLPYQLSALSRLNNSREALFFLSVVLGQCQWFCTVATTFVRNKGFVLWRAFFFFRGARGCFLLERDYLRLLVNLGAPCQGSDITLKISFKLIGLKFYLMSFKFV